MKPHLILPSETINAHDEFAYLIMQYFDDLMESQTYYFSYNNVSFLKIKKTQI